MEIKITYKVPAVDGEWFETSTTVKREAEAQRVCAAIRKYGYKLVSVFRTPTPLERGILVR